MEHLFIKTRSRAGVVVLGSIAFLWSPGLFANETAWDNYRLYLRGLLDERGGRVNQALEAYQEVLRRDPTVTYLYGSLADVALRAGRGDVAYAAAQKAVELSTGSAEGYVLLGRVSLAQGRSTEAQAAFDQAFRLDPTNVEALGWAASGRLLADPQGVRSLYEKFLSNDPLADPVRTQLAEIQRRQGDMAGAEKSWVALLEHDPTNVDAQLNLAGLYDVRGDTEAAMASYESVLELTPDNVEVLTRLGQLYLSDRSLDEARETFDRALDLEPDNAGLHFWRALVAQDERNWKEASQHMERAAKSSREPSVLLRLASYYSHQGRNKDSHRVLQDLQKSEPKNPDFMFYLALSFEDLNKPRQAIRWLERARTLDPNRADIAYHLAMNWDKRKRFDKAVPYLQRTIELEPQNHMAMNYLGYSWADRNERLPEALDLLQRAVALDPGNTAYRDSLGWVYFRMGRFAEAEVALGSAARVADDAVVWSHYGDALAALGRRPEAERAWLEGLLLEPKDLDLKKRLGETTMPDHVVPQSVPRTLLKRVEGNFKQVSSLTGLASVKVRARGRSMDANALFYFTRPGQFRLELLGALFAPQAMLVYDGETALWTPPGAGSGSEGPWLELWSQVLTGEFFSSFDHPNVTVRQEGTVLVYTGTAGEIRLDGRTKMLVEAKVSPPGGTPLVLRFKDVREVEGLRLPHEVEGDTGEFRFSLKFSRLAANATLPSGLFQLAP